MKSVKSRSRKNGQALLSLVKTNLQKNTAVSEMKHTAASRREKQTAKIRSDYDQIQDSQALQIQPQKQYGANSFVLDQGDHVDDSLWLCIYFPKLSIDVTGADKYRVIYQESKGQCIVYRANSVAADSGVIQGMTLDTARILCPTLNALPRDEKAEARHIQKLADWAYRYSSDLSVINNDTLILEVGSSTRLFKGLKTLCDLMAGQLAIEWGVDYRMAVSPAPLASITLAQQIIDKDNIPIVMQKQALRSVLGKLSVEALLSEKKTTLSSGKTQSTAFTVKDIKSLNSMGVYTLSDLWRLPYEGLLTRFGINALAHLDRLLGKQVDLAKSYEPAMSFSSELELPLEVKSNKLVLQALSKLLDELITYLITQDAGTDEIKILLTHSKSYHSPTFLVIQLSRYVRDKKHIFSLIEERFNRVLLTAPVIGVYLSADSIEVYNTSPRDLFEYDAKYATSHKNSNDWKILLEQINARLGKNKITNIASVADHRPERAWRYRQEGGGQVYDDEYLLRPMWLLPEAVRLVSCQTQLELLHGPERIENGWWDGSDIRRDYYIARDKAGARLWVYCDLKQKACWYVHGLFA